MMKKNLTNLEHVPRKDARAWIKNSKPTEKKGRVVGQPQNNMKICFEGRIRRSFPSATGVQNSYPSYSPTSWAARGNDKFSRNSSGVVFWLGLGHGTRNGGECCKGVSLTFRRSSISRSWPGDRDDEFSAKTKRGARNMNMKINAPCLGRRNEESERTRLESTRRWLFRIVKKGRRRFWASQNILWWISNRTIYLNDGDRYRCDWGVLFSSGERWHRPGC